MTAKEKAIELVDKYSPFSVRNWYEDNEVAKECALICVDEILDNLPFRDYGFKFDSICSRFKAVSEYWQEVKQEIEKL